MPSSDGRSRRAFLRASSAVGVAAIAGCVESDLASAPTPTTGTWPLERYGPQNTASAPDADPPADPTVDRTPTAGRATSLVVGAADGTQRIVVGGYEGVTTHRPDGSVEWRSSAGHAVAVRPDSGICYSAGETVRALDLTDGERRWQSALSGYPFAIVPSVRGPFVAVNGGVEAYDTEGDRRYAIRRGDGIGHAGIAIADAPYVTDVGMVERLAPRGLSRRARQRPPAAAWRVEEGVGFGHVPLVDAGTVFVTNEASGTNGGGVLALDADGTLRWRRKLGELPAGAALGPDRLFVAMVTAGTGGGGEHLYALDRTDGATDWSVSAAGAGDGSYASPVVAGESVLVGGATPDGSGHLSAYTLVGDRRWSRRFDTPVRDVTPVTDTVYAVTDGGYLQTLS